MAAMRRDRVWIAGGVAAAIVIAAASYLTLLSPQLDARAQAEQDLTDAQLQNIVLQQRINTLRQQSERSAELQDELDAARAAVPAQHDMEGFTRQLTDQAGTAGVQIQSISPGTPTMLVRPEAAPAADQSAAADDDADSTSKTAPPPSAAPAPSNLYSIDVTVVTTGSLEAQRAFLSAIETQGARRGLVTTTQLSQADDEPGQWSLTTQVETFVAPKSGEQEAVLQAPAGPSN